MARIDNLTNFLTDVASAIKEKKGTTAKIPASSFDSEIASIVTSDDVKLQEKTVTSSTSKQTVTPDSGYDALSKVTVNAIATATQATPSISVNSSGLITASATQSAGYVAAGTKSATKQLTTKGATTITPGTANQTIAANTYLTGVQTIKGDSNLIASNIRSGKSIFGVNGTLVEHTDPSLQIKTVSPSTSVQNITPDSGYDGLSKVTINAVTSAIDSDIKAANIKSGVNILGVTGTLVEAEDVSSELNSQSSLLTTQEATIDSIIAALEGKAGGSGGSEDLTEELTAQTTLVTNQTTKVNTVKNLLNTVQVGDKGIEDGLVTGALTGVYKNNRVNTIGGERLRATAITGLECENVLSVGGEGCRECKSLKYIKLPKCTSLGSYSFGLCNVLEKVELGAATSIGQYSFYNSTALKELIISTETVCSLANANALTGTAIASGTGYIYVPANLVSSYKSATNWSTYANQIRAISTETGGGN